MTPPPISEAVRAQLEALAPVMRHLCSQAPPPPDDETMRTLTQVVPGDFAWQLICLAPPVM